MSVTIGYYLKDCEVLQHAVHHVLLGEVLQLQDEVDHVLAHWASVNLVEISSSLVSGIFCFNFFHDLFSETADFSRALYCHVFGAFVPAIKNRFIFSNVCFMA